MKRRTFHTIEENAWIEKKREEEGKLEKVSSFTRQYWLKSIHLYRRTTNIARRWRRKLLGMSLLFWIQKMKKYLVPIFKSLTYKEFFRSCTMLCLDKTAFWFTELEPITRDFVAAALEEWASFVSDWDPIVKMSHQKKEDPEKRTTQVMDRVWFQGPMDFIFRPLGSIKNLLSICAYSDLGRFNKPSS